MSLSLLLVPGALADLVYWTTPPDPVSVAAVERTLPRARQTALATLVTGGAQQDGSAAIEALRRELTQVRPLFEVFDGELQIMARLRKASDDVQRLRDDADRALLWEALVVEGAAVHRYFQDKLGVEAAGAPYRQGDGADAKVGAWMDAAALILTPTPDEKLLPEASQRLAYDAVQAASRSMPAARIVVGELAIGATVRVDGHDVQARPNDRIGVVPGRHFLEIRVGDTVLLSVDTRLKPGSNASIAAPFGPAELGVLEALATSPADGWAVPTAALVPVRGAGEPVFIAVPGGDETRLMRVDQGTAARMRIARKARSSSEGLSAHIEIGGGWVSTGDWLLLNGADGAPETAATVNAGAPTLGADLAWRRGLFVGGVGVDAAYTVGDWHALPTGDSRTRAILYPHASVGVPWLQVSAGPLLPWHLGLGARAAAPIAGPLELFVSGLWGLGVEQDRGDDPAFAPHPLYAAWGGARIRLGG